MCNCKPASIPDTNTFFRLWVHEMNRVFRDRLIEKIDTDDFDNLLVKSLKDINVE